MNARIVGIEARVRPRGNVGAPCLDISLTMLYSDKHQALKGRTFANFGFSTQGICISESAVQTAADG